MRQLVVTLRTLSPVAIGYRSAHGHFMESHDYIPGSVLRGALSAEVLSHCPGRKPGRTQCSAAACPLCTEGDGRCLFPDVFSDQTGVIFGSLFPTRDGHTAGSCFLGPVPLTVRTCKHRPGSRRWHEWRERECEERADAEAAARLRARPSPHGLWDLVIPYHACLNAAPSDADPDVCGHCGRAGTSPSEPFVMGHDDAQGGYWLGLHRAETTRLARVALNRERQAAEDQMLYAVSAIAPGQTFSGILGVPDGVADEAVEYLRGLEALDGTRVLRLGGGASRGLGETRVTTEDQPGRGLPPLEQRLADLSQAAHASPDETLFTITLVDTAILRSPRTGRPVLGLTSELLDVALGTGPGTCAVEAAFQAPVHVTGWNSAWGLPKWSELGTQMGSVWLCRYSRPLDAALLGALSLVEERGLGVRTREGFGRAVVCHPIHMGRVAQ